MSGSRFDILTLFPGAFTGPMDVSMLGRARSAGLFELHLHDVREHATDSHRTVDDYPFGGGQGMVLRVDVLDRALQHVRALHPAPGKVVYLSPAGRLLTDRLVRELATEPRLILVCGRYEGIDERFVEHCVDIEVSVGDYVLTGGELPAMILVDAVARHIPGVLGDEASPEDESFVGGLLEYPQYTRPADYGGWAVPPVLMGGNHAEIEAWRREQRVARTAARRPDLLPAAASAPATPRKAGIPGVRIRPLQYPDDLPRVESLLRQAELADGLGPPAIAALVRAAPDLLLVAVERREPVGVVIAGFDALEARIHALAVDAGNRSRGIATALLAELERSLSAISCSSVAVAIPAGWAEALAFFAARGWERSDDSLWRRRRSS